MCGILGIAAPSNAAPSVSAQHAERMRDLMTHRGPDGAGLMHAASVLLGHRRLAVIDPSDAGAQPMRTPDGRFALVYNGELYNAAELRRELETEGCALRTRCDTEIVLHALALWGPAALDRFRGMFALGVVDTVERTLLLARDPLGIKPLYWMRVGNEVVFASEPPAVLAHPGVTPEPDWVTVSAYLTTIRTTLGERTMFAGLRTLLPGHWLRFELNDLQGEPEQGLIGFGTAGDDIRAVIDDSIGAHLVSDVPLCTLLSGGLDSSICALIASGAERAEPLRSYCAGAASNGPGDFEHARLVAKHLGTQHAEAVLDGERFVALWRSMVDALGVPLSTPNETAIYEVARTLRADGCIVTLSGEGADELFGGYDGPLRAVAQHVAAGNAEPGLFQLDAAAWTSREQKPLVLTPERYAEAEQDQSLVATYVHDFAHIATGADPLADHLRMMRRVNLTGLLGRLDTATMLASVEGRTPLADRRVAAAAEALPMSQRFTFDGERSRTKIVLREAFAGELPGEVVRRPKASFPLPFQGWLGPVAPLLRTSAFARSVFTRDAIELVSNDPGACWSLAWPMLNVTLWGERWWGQPDAASGMRGAASMSSLV